MIFLDALTKIYDVLIKNEAVYLFYLVPIVFFMSIVLRLMFYKLKYHKKLFPRDLMAVATMLLIFLDYVNYLYLLVTGTGKVLPISAFVTKYTFGFLLWAWMFWYSYHVHLKRNLTKEVLKKGSVIFACVVSMFVILVIIVAVVA
ncbi:MAG: hypothetical protein GY801_44555 [bacterium]|nr:hypothetical protein [bacterium]